MNYEQKFIEIPFGAKDSELKGWEYTIPDGMEAIVKDGKVIVKEKESEDEKIREEIIAYFDSEALAADETEFLYFERWIAYLEKQKNQKPTPDWMPKFLDELRSKKNYFDWDEHRDIEGQILAIITWIAPDYFKRKEEQKPQDQCVDVIKMSALLAADRLASAEMTGRLKERKEILENPEKYGLQKPIEWNEGETKVLGSIIDDYEKAAKSFCGYDGKIGLLKAIRDGEYNLPKQEWSEEDEKILNDIDCCISFFLKDGSAVAPSCNTTKEEALDWLKSLRPSWKPSEEQMEALKSTMYDYKDVAWFNNLLSLYNDLHKLI